MIRTILLPILMILFCNTYILGQILTADFESGCSSPYDCNIEDPEVENGCFPNVSNVSIGIPFVVKENCIYQTSCLDIEDIFTGQNGMPINTEPITGDQSIAMSNLNLLINGQAVSNLASGLLFELGQDIKQGSRLRVSFMASNPIVNCDTGGPVNYKFHFAKDFYPTPTNNIITDFVDEISTQTTSEFFIDSETPMQYDFLVQTTFGNTFPASNVNQIAIRHSSISGADKLNIIDDVEISCDLSCPMLISVIDRVDAPADIIEETCGNLFFAVLYPENICANDIDIVDVVYSINLTGKDDDGATVYQETLTSAGSNGTGLHYFDVPLDVVELTASHIYGDDACFYAVNNDTQITIDNGPQVFDQNFGSSFSYFPFGAIIKSGVSVTLNDAIFGEGTALVVEDGATLRAVGGTLSACEGTWQGIQAKGGSTVLLRGATVEQAFIGLSQTEFGAGSCNNIEVSSTTFKDCLAGIQMRNGTTSSTNNIIKGSIFECDFGILASQINDLEISDDNQFFTIGNGILSINSSLYIRDNKFYDAEQGIFVVNSFNPTDRTEITGNTFSGSCEIGVEFSTGNPINGNTEITNNWFESHDGGILGSGDLDLYVGDNNFYNELTGGRLINSGFSDNLFVGNNFLSLDRGIAFEQENPGGQFTGNCFFSTSTFDVASEGNIDPTVGGPQFAASNCFSQTAGFDFSFGGDFLEYYIPDNLNPDNRCLMPNDLALNFQFESSDWDLCGSPPGFTNDIPNSNICNPDSTISGTKKSILEVSEKINKLKCSDKLTWEEKLELAAWKRCMQKLLNQIAIVVKSKGKDIHYLFAELEKVNSFEVNFFLLSTLFHQNRCDYIDRFMSTIKPCTQEEKMILEVQKINAKRICSLEAKVTQKELDYLKDFAKYDSPYAAYAASLYFEITGTKLQLRNPFKPTGKRENLYVIEDISVSIYPNPFDKNVFIESNLENFEIIVLDVNGNMILEKNDISFNAELNFNDLPAGIFVLKIMQGNLIHSVERIIKY